MHARQVDDQDSECLLMYAHAQVNLIIKMHQCMLRDAAATDVYYTMLLAKQVSFPHYKLFGVLRGLLCVCLGIFCLYW